MNEMAKVIEEMKAKQNEPKMLNFLKIQRLLYSKAKFIGNVFYIIYFIIVITFSIMNQYIDNNILKAISILIGCCLFMIGIFVDMVVNQTKIKAAIIREYFDEDLFGINCNQEYFNAEEYSDSFEFKEINVKYKDIELTGIRDWYGFYNEYDRQQAILECQNQCVRWDLKLRKIMIGILCCIILMIIFMVCILTIVKDEVVSIIIILSLFSTLLSKISFSIKKLYDDIIRLKLIRKKIIDAFRIKEKSIGKNNQNVEKRIEGIQFVIFINRINSIMIPDFIYKLKKDKYQSLDNLMYSNNE